MARQLAAAMILAVPVSLMVLGFTIVGVVGRRLLNSSGTARADGSCGARPLPLAGPRSQGIG